MNGSRRIIYGLLIVAWAATARLALAHTDLVEAQPAPGAQLADAPAEIRLVFSEPVGAGSRIILLNDSFEPVGPPTAQLDSSHPQEMFIALPPLSPGTYTVQWTAISTDGHEISGSYAFGIGEGTAIATTGGSDGLRWVGLSLAGLLVALLVLTAKRRAGG